MDQPPARTSAAAVPRLESTRPIAEAQWSSIRDKFESLYIGSNLHLDEVVEILRNQYGFVASRTQYKKQMQRWRLFKSRKSKQHDAIKLNSESRSTIRTNSTQKVLQLSDSWPITVQNQSGEADPHGFSSSEAVEDQKSDSGYSTGSSSGHFILISEIASLLFVDEDIQLALAKVADRSQNSEEIVGEIAPFLYYYGQDLSLISADAAQLTVSRWVQQHAREITSTLVIQFLTEKTWHPAVTAAAESQFQTYFQKYLQSTAVSTGAERPNAEPTNLLSQSSVQLERLDGITLDDVEEFLNNSEAFERFVSFLTRSIGWDASKAIVDELSADLQSPLSDSSDYTFHINWDVEPFVREELLGIPQDGDKRDQQKEFEDLLVISGGGEAFYASSFQSYMRWLAPDTADRVLSLLGIYLLNKSDTGPRFSPLETSLLMNVSDGCSIRARGPRQMIEQLAKSLAWVAAAVRIPVQGKIMISDTRFAKSAPYDYQLSCRRLQIPFWSVRATCWLALLPGTVIAHNWPVPFRTEELKGLELPFSLMKSLVGATYPMRNQNGFHLQGYSRLLFPAQSLADNCVQWHMISSPSREDELPSNAMLNCGPCHVDDLGNLVSARTFLGFCDKVSVNLGTELSPDEYNSICYSQSQDEAHPLDFLLSSGTMGGGYKGLVNMSATMSMTFGKTLSSAVLQPETDYLDILRLASRRPYIIYDDHPSRGGHAWMVPMLSVMLHMIHTFAAQEDEIEKTIPTVARTWDSALAAKHLLVKHANFIVRNAVQTEDGTTLSQAKCMKDLVTQYWNQLTSLATVELLAGNERRTATGKLYGWDYMDVVMGKPHVRRKQVTFSNNWLSLTRDNLVLMGQDFGELIAADPVARVCRSWTAPNLYGKQYLTACIKCLQTLSWERGDNDNGRSCSRLADNTYWHFDDPKLFGDCGDCFNPNDRRDAHPRCSKMPQALASIPPDSAKSQIPPLEGAVVFGNRELNKLQKRYRSNSARDMEEATARSRPFIR